MYNNKVNSLKDSLKELKLKPEDYLYITKTAAREDFGKFKFGPRAPTACRPLY